MRCSALEPYRDPLQRARWRFDALQALLNCHRATADFRTPEQWAQDDKELARLVDEARWAVEMLEAARLEEPRDDD